jgi:hypothetical protein
MCTSLPCHGFQKMAGVILGIIHACDASSQSMVQPHAIPMQGRDSSKRPSRVRLVAMALMQHQALLQGWF